MFKLWLVLKFLHQEPQIDQNQQINHDSWDYKIEKNERKKVIAHDNWACKIEKKKERKNSLFRGESKEQTSVISIFHILERAAMSISPRDHKLFFIALTSRIRHKSLIFIQR